MKFLSICMIATLVLLGQMRPSCALELVYQVESSFEFDDPHDIQLSPDRRWLYVSDVGNHRIVVLDRRSLAYVSEFGSEDLSGPHDIDFDDQGRVLVADTKNNRILKYEIRRNQQPRLLSEFSDAIKGPESVLAHPNGLTYVAGSWSNNVIAYDKYQNIIHEAEGFSSPHDLEVRADGRIWLADSGNDRMVLLSPELDILQEIRGRDFDFSGLRYQTVLEDGTLAVADKYNHSIKFITPRLRLLTTLGTGDPGMDRYKLRTPEGVAAFKDNIWISDTGNNRIVRYRIK